MLDDSLEPLPTHDARVAGVPQRERDALLYAFIEYLHDESGRTQTPLVVFAREGTALELQRSRLCTERSMDRVASHRTAKAMTALGVVELRCQPPGIAAPIVRKLK